MSRDDFYTVCFVLFLLFATVAESLVNAILR